MKNLRIMSFLSILLCFPALFFAQEEKPKTIAQEEIFKAKIVNIEKVNWKNELEKVNEDTIQILDERTNILKIYFLGLTGSLKNKEFFAEMSYSANQSLPYQKGDVVYVSYSDDANIANQYIIITHDRQSSLVLLSIIFLFFVLIVGWSNGIKAVLSLFISFLIIIKFLIPQIISGQNPIFIGILGVLFIVIPGFYITHGVNKKITLAILATMFCVLFTQLLSIIFIQATRLSGLISDESLYVMAHLETQITDLKGLLLIGIIIGVIGILDDITVGQISVTEEIYKANPRLSWQQVFFRALRVGRHHIGSMVNTLILVYAGTSLPLFILFYIKSGYFSSFEMIINNEIIATEIVRTLVGSIGLLLAVPIATLLGSLFLKKK